MAPLAQRRKAQVGVTFGEQVEGDVDDRDLGEELGARALPAEPPRDYALRMARDAGDFLLEAEAALGHPIDIIPGHEEVRLIYLGVSHGLADSSELRLVMDIGGGSTEPLGSFWLRVAASADLLPPGALVPSLRAFSSSSLSFCSRSTSPEKCVSANPP